MSGVSHGIFLLTHIMLTLCYNYFSGNCAEFLAENVTLFCYMDVDWQWAVRLLRK